MLTHWLYGFSSAEKSLLVVVFDDVGVTPKNFCDTLSRRYILVVSVLDNAFNPHTRYCDLHTIMCRWELHPRICVTRLFSDVTYSLLTCLHVYNVFGLWLFTFRSWWKKSYAWSALLSLFLSVDLLLYPYTRVLCMSIVCDQS